MSLLLSKIRRVYRSITLSSYAAFLSGVRGRSLQPSALHTVCGALRGGGLSTQYSPLDFLSLLSSLVVRLIGVRYLIHIGISSTSPPLATEWHFPSALHAFSSMVSKQSSSAGAHSEQESPSLLPRQGL
mmetsp:Transcript_3948/g.13029  ORF Transcript_3948/g.13029 Transcript_3948/m.13029 type:complete len:129 (+) Transcript_3948:160-546(+)